ncbi:hypothetical protein GCM10022631_29600 [Deinococcus rubellus]|uniref:Uncharacterized protein n=1 Tax=Deinococcus rubellus TaxID=1889240 RepID=A0ABY5YIW4_9DEIO|nr:hypothetical protein [Deinococcus rubellus]UWX64194.1 hypothetical protein N0D28_00495 [Deinococcus rubellus]
MTKSDALDRVKVAEDPNQDEAASIFVDATSGADIAHVTVNPNLVSTDALAGYQVRGAVASVLEGLRRYNRTMTRKYGTYDAEQLQFDQAISRAEFELEQLVHAGPPVSNGAPEIPAPPAPVADPVTVVTPDPVQAAPSASDSAPAQTPAPDPAPAPEVTDAGNPDAQPAPAPDQS